METASEWTKQPRCHLNFNIQDWADDAGFDHLSMNPVSVLYIDAARVGVAVESSNAIHRFTFNVGKCGTANGSHAQTFSHGMTFFMIKSYSTDGSNESMTLYDTSSGEIYYLVLHNTSMSTSFTIKRLSSSSYIGNSFAYTMVSRIPNVIVNARGVPFAYGTSEAFTV